MQNKSYSYYRFIIALLVIWPLFTGCYSYLSSPGIPFGQNQKLDYFDKLIDKLYDDVNMTGINYRLPQDCDLTVKRFDSNGRLKEEEANRANRVKAAALNAPLLLEFVWLSDVHITQREIKLGSKLFSSALDEVAGAAEFNNAQEDFNWAVYLSQIAAINALHREALHSENLENKGPVDFMIHTGDSVNTGSLEELYQFIYISNKLEIPWLNVVGNHDTTIFGNYKARLGYGHDPNVTFYPIGDLGNFVWMHRSKDESKISGFGRHLLPVPTNCQHKYSIETWPGKKLPPTFLHGFDLNLGKDCDDKHAKNFFDDSFYDQKNIGDYATDLSKTIRLIVLNSALKDVFGSEGSIDNSQCNWLTKCKLLQGKGIKLVFFHHRPTGYAIRKVKTLLENGEGTTVVFTGHVHPKSKYDVTWYPGKNGRGFYELNTGSILEFPQIGRLIELRGEPGKSVWLIARALWNDHMELLEKMTSEQEEMPTEEERKAVIRYCTDPKKNLKDMEALQKKMTETKTKPKDRDALQQNIKEAVRCGNYGAYDDYLANMRRFFFWSRPQAFEKTWKNANMIIKITPQKSSE